MQNVYKVLASQYDPLGFILPYTTHAKVLVQCLWDKHRDWDDPLLPQDLLQAWNDWEGALRVIPSIHLARCYLPADVDQSSVTRDVHVFCDVSERAYGSVAYLRTEDSQARNPAEAGQGPGPTDSNYQKAETLILQRAQEDSFLDELHLLKAGKPIQSSSYLITLPPELDESGELIQVGGRLCRVEDLEHGILHPIVLNPSYLSTKLLIQDYESRLCHPGPERVFAEIHRTYWILQGRESVRRYQHTCKECHQWKSRPVVPKMTDLMMHASTSSSRHSIPQAWTVLDHSRSSIADLDPVTPNLILMGRPDGCLPQVMYPETELLSRRRLTQHSQILMDHFWSSFIRHYLPSLQACQKWHATRADLTKDKVVMLVDPLF
ncbi:hypothetical protein AAFF_G00394220 [Aldrovandia affinis]|uniref:Integrase zinc-binding domain-containing protein n=1 Tax=Aldrovandia affinis TaxID=143900 RepID=A0AAD7SE31_9TELE|nr:hypothetical protein AAFF_G00394220 [Aldrovandia affinis]